MAWTLGRVFLIAFILECTNFTGIVAPISPRVPGTRPYRPPQRTEGNTDGLRTDTGDRPRSPMRYPPMSLPRRPVREPDSAVMNGGYQAAPYSQGRGPRSPMQKTPSRKIQRTSYPETRQSDDNRFAAPMSFDLSSKLSGGTGDYMPGDEWVAPQSPFAQPLRQQVRRSPSCKSPEARWLGSDGQPKTAEEMYKEILQRSFKDPPSLTPTAVVTAVGQNGKTVYARILLDTGAQGCSIGEDLVRKLGLTRAHLESEESTLRGVGGVDISTHRTKLQLCSRFSKFCLPVEGAISKRPIIAGAILDARVVPQQSNLQLAEEGMPESMTIDILVGVDFFEQLFLHEAQRIKGFPIFYRTQFGWMAFGKGQPGFKYMMLSNENEKQLADSRKQLGLQ